MDSNNDIQILLRAAHRGGISYRHLASLLRVARQTLYNWIERGEFPDDKLDDITKLVKRINNAVEIGVLPVKSPEVVYRKLTELLNID